MAPSLPCASLELDYPLYALDFDPDDGSRLVVGGGGGAGRASTDGNKTVLEARTDELRVTTEMELSRDEDSVMSLAFAPPPGQGKPARLLAGVNSSAQELSRGVNQHLRALTLDRRPSKARLSESSRTALFANPDPDVYQRLLRVEGPIGAAASAMGRAPQIALFEAAAKVKARGLLELPVDAEDLDLVQTGEGEFSLAFCSKSELHLVGLSAKANCEPRLVYAVPEGGRRPAFRAVRFLMPGFLLGVLNLPQRRGVLLQAFRLPSSTMDMATVAAAARISRNISATALAIANPSPSQPPWTKPGDAQFIIAVASTDSSISLFSLDHHSASALSLLSGPHPVCTVEGSGSITGLAFSPRVGGRLNLGLSIVIMALIGQAIMELYGQSPPRLLNTRLTPSWHNALTRDRPLTSSSFLLGLKTSSASPGKTMLISSSSTSVLARSADGSAAAAARSWDELGDELRGAWRRRLSEVGAWTQDMGEEVFRGVLFGEIAGVIGRVVQG
ncbi:hypothetical protein CDD80_7276 [Ophiocordyceps camponoti-rufipedis]|uniref:Guanine nucleotide-exchange factor SEC12 n=1 Tax=Ophiocordyceps camponoti-rufipedis TaxID=2004952 RepID=A0A2C5YM14_9HYPO|nr:hypothetical protein CDD80_7276 [Ophiocordyceps camponoti-rufipedis]